MISNMISLLIGLILIALLITLWHSTMRARERAVQEAKARCERAQVQLLDDTVAVHKIMLRKNAGRWGIKREYHFDYTADGDNRLQGKILIVGGKILSSDLNKKSSSCEEAQIIQLKDFRKP